MNIIYYFAASLDGYIADAQHGVDWLDRIDIDQNASGYDEFFAKIDGLLMGRKTYDFVYNYGKWPYEDRPTWVCSHSDVPGMDGCNLQPARDPVQAIDQAKESGITNIWLVGGGQLASQLIRQALLTHLSVSVMPVLLGSGIGIVESLGSHCYLRQESSSSSGGFTQIDYRVN